MPNKEMVIRGLECCISNAHNKCPYWDKDNVHPLPCSDRLHADALALLKEQESRVLDIDELKNFEVVWFEARNHLYIEPMLTRSKNFADASTDWFRYGKEWRCWTSKPTIDQREAVKWDE